MGERQKKLGFETRNYGLSMFFGRRLSLSAHRSGLFDTAFPLPMTVCSES